MPAKVTRTQVVDCTCTPQRPHGDPTSHNYNYHKCGCDLCRDNQRRLRKFREYQVSQGKGRLVDPGPVADYLLLLKERGMTYREISERSGVNVSALHRIYTRKAVGVGRDKAKAIRSIPLPSIDRYRS